MKDRSASLTIFEYKIDSSDISMKYSDIRMKYSDRFIFPVVLLSLCLLSLRRVTTTDKYFSMRTGVDLITNIIKGFTLVVESKQLIAIEKAHKKAVGLFLHTSDIDSELTGFLHFSIVTQNIDDGLSESALLERIAQKTFIEWCEKENERRKLKLFKLCFTK